jgi:hypothetical protein
MTWAPRDLASWDLRSTSAEKHRAFELSLCRGDSFAAAGVSPGIDEHAG